MTRAKESGNHEGYENFEHVLISNNLRMGSHAVVRFLSKESSSVMANKENSIFLFGQLSSVQG